MNLASSAVLVLGGYGLFGQRVCAGLLRQSNCRVLLAGRNLKSAQQCVQRLCQHNLAAAARVQALSMDAQDPCLVERLRESGAGILIHCAGPFQAQDYAVARAAIAAGLHYIDLADSGNFVQGIGELDAAATAANVTVLSGASSVPALSGAVIAQLAQGLRVTDIDIGISPGNKTERGLATMQAILGYAGEPIPGWRSGAVASSRGWLNLRAHRYALPAGKRWLVDCDVPDLTLLPARYPDLRNIRFGAGLELSVLHFGLHALAHLRAWRLLPNLARFAKPMKIISEWFLRFGSDVGAMHVEIQGIDASGQQQRRGWQLIAEQGDGPHVPAAASIALAKALLAGKRAPGAGSADSQLGLADILAVLDGLQITTRSF